MAEINIYDYDFLLGASAVAQQQIYDSLANTSTINLFGTTNQIVGFDLGGNPVPKNVGGDSNGAGLAFSGDTLTATLPQNLKTTGTPTFAGLTLNDQTANRLLFASSGKAVTSTGISYDATSVTIGDLQSIDFAITPTNAIAARRLQWSETEGTLELGLKGGGTALHVGLDHVTRIINKTGGNLLKSEFRVIRAGSSVGVNRIGGELAQANSEANSTDVLGIVCENISNNQEGFIMTWGEVSGIDTTGAAYGETGANEWNEGDPLYLSPSTYGGKAGALTKIKPKGPNHLVIIGYVVSKNANNGRILVHVQSSWETSELHDVQFGASMPLAGSVLIRNATLNVWQPAQLAAGSNVTITNADGAITIAAAPGMVYPGAGIPVSTGTAWDTSKAAPTGDIVGTSDSQTLSNKTLSGPTISGLLTLSNGSGSTGQVVTRSATGVQWADVTGITNGDKGDITVTSAGTGSENWAIDAKAVTYAKIQDVTPDRLLGRANSPAGVIEEITCTAAGRALLDDADATAQRTTLGLSTLATQSLTAGSNITITNPGTPGSSITIASTGGSAGRELLTANRTYYVGFLPGTAGTGAITIASGTPAVITCTGHSLTVDTPVVFTAGASIRGGTTGTLPAGIVEGATYYVRTVLSANTFTVSYTVGGTAVSTAAASTGACFIRTGNDSSTGLNYSLGASGALLNINRAIDLVAGIDLGPYSVTIQICKGRYVEQVNAKTFVGAGPVTLRGNPTTPQEVYLSPYSGVNPNVSPSNSTIVRTGNIISYSGGIAHGLQIGTPIYFFGFGSAAWTGIGVWNPQSTQPGTQYYVSAQNFSTTQFSISATSDLNTIVTLSALSSSLWVGSPSMLNVNVLGQYNLNGVAIGSNTYCYGLRTSQAYMEITNTEFGGPGNTGNHIWGANGSFIYMVGAIILSQARIDPGGTPVYSTHTFQVTESSTLSLRGATLTVVGSLTFNNFVRMTRMCTLIADSFTFSGPAATGQRFLLEFNCTARVIGLGAGPTFPSSLPGNSDQTQASIDATQCSINFSGS